MFCTKCGSEVNSDAKFCGKCGNITETQVATPQNNTSESVAQGNRVATIRYAGFWIRYAAGFLDGIITTVIAVAVSMVFFLLAPFSVDDELSNGSLIVFLLLFWGAIFGYFIIFTYKKGATLGKMAVGIKVVSADDRRLSLGKVFLRETVGKILSYVTLYIGYIMAGFTEKKQALHDKIAQTYVVYKDPNQKNNTWIILLILIPVFIAVIGILASIVLVSLSSAREKAREAAFKAQVSSIIPQALLVCDQRNITQNDLVGSGETQYFGVEDIKKSLKQDCGNLGASTFSFSVKGTGDYESFSADCSEQGCNFSKEEAGNSSGDAGTGAQVDSVENVLIETSEEINKSLPMMVDEVTQLTTTTASGNELFYSYKFLGTQKITQSDLVSSLQEDIVNQACTTPETMALLDAEATFKYRYYDKNGKYIGEIPVGKSDCPIE